MAPAATSTASHWPKESFSHVINGQSYPTKGAKMIDVINPADESVVAQVPVATKEVVDEAVRSARAAFPKWSQTSWAERKALLQKWHDDWIVHNKADLLKIYTAEQGRTLQLSEFEWGTTELFWDLNKYPEPKDEVVEDDGQGNVNILRKYPMGIVAALVPWNYPLILSFWKIIPVLLTGNVIIVKPSPFTPLMTIQFIVAAQKYLPPGVIQIVVGDDSLGPMLTEHPDIDHISFTGSTNTGRLVAKSCAATLKRMTLELGGNDACIILPGIDMTHVPLQVFLSALQNSGQFCAAAKRIYVHEDIYDEFAAQLVGIAKATKMGDGMDPANGLGPVNNRQQFNKVNEFLADIAANKQKVLVGGEKHTDKGFFVPATIVDNPPDTSKIVIEEPFGPVLPLLKFKDEDEVVRRANDTRMGLGGMVWGPIEQAQRIADRLETGTVWVNQMQNFNPLSYFGGWKDSGIGGLHGRQGLEHLMRSKTLKLVRVPPQSIFSDAL